MCGSCRVLFLMVFFFYYRGFHLWNAQKLLKYVLFYSYHTYTLPLKYALTFDIWLKKLIWWKFTLNPRVLACYGNLPTWLHSYSFLHRKVVSNLHRLDNSLWHFSAQRTLVVSLAEIKKVWCRIPLAFNFWKLAYLQVSSFAMLTG